MTDKKLGFSSGDVLEGKYRVEEVIGEGGMGVVLRATHQRLGEPVAIKVLQPAAAEHAEVLGRFQREARIAAKLRSPHVARTIDVGELDSGAPFIVMEYLTGEDFDDRLDRGTLSPEDAVDIILQAIEALAEAHELGVVHRDLKPANLFIEKLRNGREVVKVLDFGISKLKSTDEIELTQTAALMGSPLYMSPEQMRNSRDVDHRTDIWSLGVILYRALTGKMPFAAETVTELAIVVSQEVPTPLRTHAPALAAELQGVVLSCLAKEREHRPQTVVELAKLLAPFASEEGRRLAASLKPRPVGTPLSEAPLSAEGSRATSTLEATAPAEQEGTLAPGGHTVVPVRGRSALGRAALFVGSAVVLGVVTFFWMRGEKPPEEREPVSAASPAQAAEPAPVPSDRPEPAPEAKAAPGVESESGSPDSDETKSDVSESSDGSNTVPNTPPAVKRALPRLPPAPRPAPRVEELAVKPPPDPSSSSNPYGKL